MIDDAALPCLADLGPEALARITGARGAELLRLRYRPGRRAILHVVADGREGVIWGFAGDKGASVAKKNPAARYDARTRAVFEIFPYDHRLPQLAEFLAAWPDIAPRLCGEPAERELELLRYRPGLSCTFRATTLSGKAIFVKVVADVDPSLILEENHRLAGRLAGGPVGIAPAIGFDRRCRAVAFAEAGGAPLDRLLPKPGGAQAVEQARAALRSLGRLADPGLRRKDAQALTRMAWDCQELIATLLPGLADVAGQVVARIMAGAPPSDLSVIHGDVKIEHLFLDGPRVTLVDTESMAVGPADYDAAMLFARIVMAGQIGAVPIDAARRAAAAARGEGGEGFDWCLRVAALRLAKFHAQRPSAEAEERAAAILAALT